jgi:class 3 adenylate cyclase
VPTREGRTDENGVTGRATGGGSQSFREELRLFLESVCCDLCRFEHVATEHIAPEDVVIRQEVAVGPSAFADIQVTPRGTAPYFVEVDYGYTPQRLIESLRRKYGEPTDATAAASKVVLVIDANGREDWPGLQARARSVLRPGLALEVWDERRLDELVCRRFGVSLGSLEEHDRLELRSAVDRAKWRHAFGDDFSADALESTLLWHFGFWRLRQLREAGRKTPRDILPPALYPNVVVVTADLSGYTRFVRDTRDDDVVRRSLTAFASRARYQIINAGGMLYQFLGDSVIAIFGIPDAGPDDAERGFVCASALIDIGASVAIEWQRQIDQIQPSTGVHVAMATGDLQVIEFRPFSRAHVGVVGDAINLAGRLCGVAQTHEIVVSNSLYRRLSDRSRDGFLPMEPVEAKNLGSVRAWKLAPRAGSHS